MKFKLKKLDENVIYKILFILILAIAIGVRIVQWPYAISQVNIDEAMTAINAKTIADSGVDMYGTSFPVYLEAWGVAGQSVMLLYLMAFFIKIFGLSFISIRLPMLIVSIISIIVFYDFTKRIFNNKKLALCAMAFISICPWHLLQSIWSIDCNMFPHFMLISIYLLYRGVTDKKWLLYLSMVFFALTMYTYGVSVIVVPLFLLICAIYLIVKKLVTVKQVIICIIIYFLFSFPIFTMYVINAFKIETNIHIGPITIQYFKNNARTDDMIFFSNNIVSNIINNVKYLLSTFFTQYDTLAWNGTKTFGTIYHISIIFFFIGIIYLIMHKEKRNTGTFFFAVWLILSILPGIIIEEANINRLNTIWIPTLFFSFYGIYFVCSKIKFFKYIISVIYVLLFICFTTYLYTSYTSVIGNSWCFSAGYTDALHYSTQTLQKNNVCLCGSNKFSTYIKFQDYLDNTSSELVYSLTTFIDRLNNKKQNEAFIITDEYLTNINIDLDNFNDYTIRDTHIIY